MMKVSVANVGPVMARLRAAVAANANAQYQEKTQNIFIHLLQVTPQWSGDLVANWRITTDQASDASASPFKEQNWKGGPWQKMGDPEAMAYAIEASAGMVYDYTKSVYFTNGTPLTFSDTLVSGSGVARPVRPENLINQKVAMVSYIVSVYKSGVLL